MSVTSGSLTAVIGAVGAGKSSLLSATLGEMHRSSGTVSIKVSSKVKGQGYFVQSISIYL